MGNKRMIGYDIIRVFAIFMVVMIHSNVAFLANNQFSISWFVVMEVTSFCLVAVPLYFMVSGALLLDCERVISIRELLKKRIAKQGIPFLVWSFIYVFVRIIMGKIDFSPNVFLNLLSVPAYYQFWFMYTLLGIYLLLPVLQVLVMNLSKRSMEYVLGIWFVFSILQPTAAYLFPMLKLSEHVDLILCEGYVGYFLLGYYLKKYYGSVSKRNTLLISIAGFIMIGVVAFLEAKFSKNSYSGYFYKNYLTPSVVLAVSGIFLLFQNNQWKPNSKWIPVIDTLSKCSLGVFYVHMLVMVTIEYNRFDVGNNIFICGLKCIFIYIISMEISYMLSKIPILKRVMLGMS